jgi:hypothetical protein
VRAFSRLYGSSPLHLLLAGAAFAVTGYAVYRAFDKQPALAQAKWFLGAIVAHDFIVLPLYSLVLIGLLFAVGGRAAREGRPLSRRRLLVLNHVRVPAALSLLALLLFFPLILGLSESGYQGVSGLSTDPYLPRFAFLTLALFALSGAVLAVRLLLGRRRSTNGSAPPATPRAPSDC